MIKVGDIIKHKAYMDVAIQVLFTSTNPENEEIIIKGVWINQGQIQSYYINAYYINEFVERTIQKSQLPNWFKCMKPKSKFIRNEEWKQL